MALTLGLTGMDPATETALKAAFGVANASLGGPWSLAGEADADHIVVDMDSMYGPMSWLRLHAAGKHVIGLTSAPRTQTDFRLGRPFDATQLAQLLSEVAAMEGVTLAGAATEIQPEPAVAAIDDASAPVPPLADAPVAAGPPEIDAPAAESPAVEAPAVEPPAVEPPAVDATAVDAPPVDAPADGPGAADPTVITPSPAPPEPPAPPVPPAAPAPLREVAEPPAPPYLDPPAPPAAPARDPVFADWLRADALPGRMRYRRESGPTLLLDTAAQTWHGPTPLKPIAAYFDGVVRADDFEPVPDGQWVAESAALGAAQPMSRLRWLGGLLAGRGSLLPEHDPDAKYVLGRWPQTEREYPKHFRIATAMMKGPATLADIAAASGIPEADVADFINANLETGFAEVAMDAPPPPPEAAKPGGLLGRLRGR